MALEKQGDANARAAYEQLLKNFADQKEFATQARQRLAALTTPRTAGAMAQRRLLTGNYYAGAPSPSGRYIPYEKDNHLFLFDRSVHSSRRIVAKPEKDGSGIGHSAVSPDERQVAYYQWEKAAPPQIRLVSIDGSNNRLFFTDSTLGYAWPAAWSPDGKWIAAWARKKDAESASLVLLNALNGQMRAIATSPSTSLRVHFSADGQWIALDWRKGNRPQVRLQRITGGEPVELLDESVHPGSSLVGWLRDGRLLFTSYRDSTQSLYAIRVEDGKPTGTPELLKKDLGSRLLRRATASYQSGDIFLDQQAEASEIYEAEVDSAAGTILPSAPIRSRFTDANWSPEYSPDGRFLAFLSGLPGSANMLLHIRDLQSGQTRGLPYPARGINPLRWYPDGSALLAAETTPGGTRLSRVDVSTGSAQRLTYGPFRGDAALNPTFSPDGKYLYCKTHTNQPVGPNRVDTELTRVDLQSGQTSTVYSSGADERMRLFALSPDGSRFLLSMRTKENEDFIAVMPVQGGPWKAIYHYPKGLRSRAWGGLWWAADNKHAFFHSPSLYDRDELYVISVAGGAPKKLLETREIRMGRAHPDNRRIIWEGHEYKQELWVLEGVATR
ncbi:MAG: PD40 domain-containing protein [Acidobacteria bacterium]|nr:PD40 domain-containing protein [Acidobacteriota bacterium]